MTADCPTPDKVAFDTYAAAQTEAVRIRIDLRGGDRWAYICACDRWHLTSKRPEIRVPTGPRKPVRSRRGKTRRR